MLNNLPADYQLNRKETDLGILIEVKSSISTIGFHPRQFSEKSIIRQEAFYAAVQHSH
jgi:hypothetical protein